MIVRKGQPPVHRGSEEQVRKMGAFESHRFSDAGKLTQFGAYVETLQPGSRSSERHWHEQEDEFLYMLEGHAVVIEDDGEHPLHPGDAACWPAGVANAHQVVNRSDRPCTYLIMGPRLKADIVHYPDLQQTQYTDNGKWRVVDANGVVIRDGIE